MKKETSIAIFLGIVLGVVLAIIMVLRTQKQEESKNKLLNNTVKVSPTTPIVNNKIQSFEIRSPLDKSVVNTSSITIKGTAEKDSLLVVQSPVKDLAIKNNSETINMDFPLVLGENVIHLTIYPKDSQLRPQEKELRVYYLDE